MGARVVAGGLAVLVGLVVSGCSQHADKPATAPRPTMMVAAPTATQPQAASSERGKYLVLIGGCNHCHTPGYSLPGGEEIPESYWLTGVALGWRGGWGTTYASSLRPRIAGAYQQPWAGS